MRSGILGLVSRFHCLFTAAFFLLLLLFVSSAGALGLDGHDGDSVGFNFSSAVISEREAVEARRAFPSLSGVSGDIGTISLPLRSLANITAPRLPFQPAELEGTGEPSPGNPFRVDSLPRDRIRQMLIDSVGARLPFPKKRLRSDIAFTGSIGIYDGGDQYLVPVRDENLARVARDMSIFRASSVSRNYKKALKKFVPSKTRRYVRFSRAYKPGEIIIMTDRRRLYLVVGKGRALEFSVAIGKEGKGWYGTEYVSQKRKWPEWRPTDEMRKADPSLKAVYRGGKRNPLGARALYLGDTLYRVHGTNNPSSIGKAASSGCFRMLNRDIEFLYDLVPVGTKVSVI